MRRPIGAIESPDGGEWRVIFLEEQKLKGWTFHAGMTSVPGPVEVAPRKDLYELAAECATADELFTKLKMEIAKEVNNAGIG